MKAYYICKDSRGDFKILNFDVFVRQTSFGLVDYGELKWLRVPTKDIIYFYELDEQSKDLSIHESDQLKRFIERLKG